MLPPNGVAADPLGVAARSEIEATRSVERRETQGRATTAIVDYNLKRDVEIESGYP